MIIYTNGVVRANTSSPISEHTQPLPRRPPRSSNIEQSTMSLDMESIDRDFVIKLQSEIISLQRKVKELEDENSKLKSQSSKCCCHKIVQGNEPQQSIKKTKKKKIYGQSSESYMKIMSHHPKRYVALKIMYFGQRFYGFSSEAQLEPTIESEFFKALAETRLLVGTKKESQYSRCGRTDKGVSSFGQVIALFLRSKLKESCTIGSNCGDVSEEQYEGELDYVRVLNRALPKDIRVLGWCPAPVGFSARFTCLSREYKYLFWSNNMNLQAMESAGTKFLGEHDFRNFCKMDAANVHIYNRNLTSFGISPCSKRFEDNQLWSIRLRGSAFLWHQVRCMVAVLFMIGLGLESPDVIDTLLDTEKTPRKPQYAMAAELPLILVSCEFEGLNFICSDAQKALRIHLEDEYHNYQLQAAVFHEALLSQLDSTVTKGNGCLGNGQIRKKTSHIPLMSRPTEPTYEERRAKIELVNGKLEAH